MRGGGHPRAHTGRVGVGGARCLPGVPQGCSWPWSRRAPPGAPPWRCVTSRSPLPARLAAAAAAVVEDRWARVVVLVGGVPGRPGAGLLLTVHRPALPGVARTGCWPVARPALATMFSVAGTAVVVGNLVAALVTRRRPVGERRDREGVVAAVVWPGSGDAVLLVGALAAAGCVARTPFPRLAVGSDGSAGPGGGRRATWPGCCGRTWTTAGSGWPFQRRRATSSTARAPDHPSRRPHRHRADGGESLSPWLQHSPR